MNIAVLISVILLCGAAAQEDSVAPTSGHNDPPGRNPCTRGPAFWCTSFDNADLCKAFDYCLHHVWVNETAGPAFDARMRLVSFLQGSVTKAMAELQPAGVAFTECDCEACKYIVNLFDSFFQRNSTQSLIETYFNKLCQNVPEPMRPMCTQTVEKHFMVLISAFGQIDPPKRCVEECDNVAAQSKQSRPRVINDVMPPPVNTCLCQVCQHVVKILDQELMKGDVQTGSLADFEMFCSYVSPASASNKCTEDAKKYIPELYSLLSHMDPLRTCNRFAFCKNSTFQPPKAPFIATTTKPEIPCLSPELLLVLAGEADADLVAEEYDDNCDCEICKYTVGQFNACLQRNSTQSIINTFYHKLCQNLPPPMQLNCVDIVAKHFMTLIRDVSDLDPIKACSDDCRPHTELALGDVDVKTTNSCLCQRCQGLIKEYANDMASPDRQQFAVSYFTRICTFMPTTSISNKCKETANSYLPELMNMLSHVDPVSTCSHFKYCQKKAP